MVLLDGDGVVSQATQAVGIGETRLLFTPTAVLIGLVYGYLPFMVLPLYAAIERIDWASSRRRATCTPRRGRRSGGSCGRCRSLG